MTLTIDKTPVAVVTGGSGGIGRSIVRKLLRDGHHVVAQYSKNEESARNLERELASCGRELVIQQADLSTANGVRVLIDAVSSILASHPRWQLRALVNNAGRMLGPSFHDTQVSDFDSYFTLNTRAPFFLTQELSKHMGAGSSVINVSSAATHFSSPGDIVYAMSKAALESLTLNAAEYLAVRGIRINSVVPGFTNNGNRAFENDEVREYMSSFSVLGGVSDPDVVAEAVSFLASERSKRTTGSLLDVSGGSLLNVKHHSSMSLHSFVSEAK